MHVGIADHLERSAVKPLEHVDAGGEVVVVAAEHLAHALDIAHPHVSVVVLAVGHQQRVHAVNLGQQMDLIKTVLAAADRDQAIVVAAVRRPVVVAQLAKQRLALVPVDALLLFMGAATAAHALVVEHDCRRGRGRIDAAAAILHERRPHTGFKLVCHGINSS